MHLEPGPRGRRELADQRFSCSWELCYCEPTALAAILRRLRLHLWTYSLRELQDSDLPVFWEQLTDPELQQMAAVTRKYHYDRGHFDQHWAKVRSDPSVISRTVLAELIKLEPTRPLHADAAADNAGSIRVLEKCGFTVTGKSRCFARARGEEIDLVHLALS